MAKDYAGLASRGYAAYMANVAASRRIGNVNAKIKAGAATHIDTHTVAAEYGAAASRALLEVLTPDAVGDVMERELAMLAVDPVLRANYEAVSEAGTAIQTTLYKRAGFGLTAQRPPIDENRLDGLIEKLTEGEYVNTLRFLGEPVSNFTEHVADALVRANAAFQSRAGFEPYVTRILAPGCCEWCEEMGGKYAYNSQPDGLWRRHEHCHCVMDYNPGDTRQILTGAGSASGRSKKWVIY